LTRREKKKEKAMTETETLETTSFNQLHQLEEAGSFRFLQPKKEKNQFVLCTSLPVLTSNP
jgi:hypothetical protein